MNDPAPDGDIASVWSALRRRKVVQWGVAYVRGWGFLQGLEYVTESFQWPPLVAPIALVVLLVQPEAPCGGTLAPPNPLRVTGQPA